MKALRHLARELETLRAAKLLRTAHPALPSGALQLCSNDYLGYAAQPWPAATSAELESYAGGAGASRLVSGDSGAARALEEDLAAWLEQPAALLFTSGYAANVGLLSAIAQAGDVIISDELNHASIIDGCRLSRARVVVTTHRDSAAVERALQQHRGARRRFVVTESYFSMDGDTADLATLRRLCDQHDAALLVDEAHALGVFGAGGRGCCHLARVKPDALVGTFGKSLGSQGAFVAGSELLRQWLWNRARSFVFSTGISPALAHLTRARLRQVVADDAGRQRLHELCDRFRTRLLAAGAPLLPSSGPIVPWLVGGAARTLACSQALMEQGVFIGAIRPPTVPEGSARLRITLRATLSDADLQRAIDALLSLLDV